MSIELNIGAPGQGDRPIKDNGLRTYERPWLKHGAKIGPPGAKARMKAKKKLANLPVEHNQSA